MKRIILAAILAAAFGAAQAQTVSSHSSAVTGSASVSGVVGTGYGLSIQKSGATAYNASSAYANGSSGLLASGAKTGAASEGATSSYTIGINAGSAFGASAAMGKQEGSASATAGGLWLFGGSVATSQADVGSKSVSANVNNGLSINGTHTSAWNESEAVSKKGPGFSKITGGTTNGGTSSVSGGVAGGAFGATGGTAVQWGAGAGF